MRRRNVWLIVLAVALVVVAVLVVQGRAAQAKADERECRMISDMLGSDPADC